MNHKLIIGENYDALQNLLCIYNNRIDFIYIDPPYNTGNKFIYKDKMERINWLNMMNERLLLAKQLLSDEGVIFISIDDSEQAYLKVLCDEVFGEDNFVDSLIITNRQGKNDSKYFRINKEYCLCYSKNIEYLTINNVEITNEKEYTLQDNYKERGKYKLVKLDCSTLGWVKSLDYPIEYDGQIIYAGGDKDKWEDRQRGGASIKDWGWRWSKDKLEWGIKNDFVVFKKNKEGKYQVYTKQYLNCDNEGNIVERTQQPSDIIDNMSTLQSKNELKQLFNGICPFNYAKSVKLIRKLLKLTTKPNSICLDFFAGSGTTGQAVMELNKEDGGNRQFILITNNENNIATDITYERIKRVIGYE